MMIMKNKEKEIQLEELKKELFSVLRKILLLDCPANTKRMTEMFLFKALLIIQDIENIDRELKELREKRRTWL